MHEWALAEAVISTALKVAEKEKLRELTKIKIKIGELQQIDREIFEFALKEVIQPQKAVLETAEIEIETDEAVFQCRICRHRWTYTESMAGLTEDDIELIHFIPEVSHTYIKCRECNSPDFEVLKGRGVWIHDIQGRR